MIKMIYKSYKASLRLYAFPWKQTGRKKVRSSSFPGSVFSVFFRTKNWELKVFIVFSNKETVFKNSKQTGPPGKFLRLAPQKISFLKQLQMLRYSWNKMTPGEEK